MKTTRKVYSKGMYKLGVKPNEPIELIDELLYWLIKAICGVENGDQYANYYSRDIIERATQLAKL